MLGQVLREAFMSLVALNRARAPAPTLDDAALVRSVNPCISARDEMFGMDPVLEHYLGVGISGIRCIDAALDTKPHRPIRKILDLPCGHGRVLRFFPCRFPGATVVACDLDRDGVDFCQENFGAIAAYSSPDLENLSLGRTFDLIW